MGYQLWTSPLTGYRRKGTRLAELRALIEAGITARAILEPLQSCPANAPALDMARLLEERDLDLAGVRNEREGPVIGFVSRESLTVGVVSDHTRALTAEHLISEATPLLGTLSVLRDREHAFVLVGPEVKGIVTRADLNKPPLRIYLFGLVSLVEMHLTFWVRAEYPRDAWTAVIRHKRLTEAQRIQAERKARNQESDLVECLQMCDKRDLILERRQLCIDLGLADKKKALKLLKRVEDLRNLLAHGQENLVQGSSWEALISLVESIETLLQKSDERVERSAASSAKRGLDPLWSSA